MTSGSVAEAKKVEIPMPPLPKSFDGNFFNGPVPLDKIKRHYTKSAGAGGQHVQKTCSKVTLTFEVDGAIWLPQWIRERLHMMYSNRINKKGELSVTCETGRSQLSNERDACRMLMDLIHSASEDPEDPYKSTLKRIQKEKQREKRKQASSSKHRKIREARLAKFAEAAEVAKNWTPDSNST